MKGFKLHWPAIVVVLVVSLVSNLFWTAMTPRLARAVQHELVPPVTGIYTGVQYMQKVGDAFRSLAGCQKGATAPANVDASAVDGLCWIDDSVDPWVIKRYVNGDWAIEGYLDSATSAFVGIVGGGGIGTIASSSTTDLGTVPQANITITGTTGISSFGATALEGITKFIRFGGALVLTHSNSLVIPNGGYPLTTAAGDRARVTHLGSGNWEISDYTRASGIPLDAAAVGKIEFGMYASVPAGYVAGFGQGIARASYPAYLARVTRAQNGTRTSGNATITGLTDTTGFIDQFVEGTGIAAGCFISSFTGTTITLNSSSCVTSSGTSTVTVFLTNYGAGASASNVGVPDCRGRVLAGRDRNDPGSYANRLTTGSSNFGFDTTGFGVVGGNQNIALGTTNVPSHTHGVTVSGTTSTDGAHTHTTTVPSFPGGNGIPPGTGFVQLSSTSATSSSSGSHSHTVSASGTTDSGSGSGTAFRTAQPTLIAECIVRVIP